MLATIVAVISIIVAIVGLGINLIAIGIYVGKLEGFKELVNFKFEQQDKKLEKHNNFITRVYKLEQNEAVLEEQMNVANHRIKDLEREDHEKNYNSLDCRN